MMLSEEIRREQAISNNAGDLPVFVGDMEPLEEDDFEVVEAAEPERYGKKYFHLGQW